MPRFQGEPLKITVGTDRGRDGQRADPLPADDELSTASTLQSLASGATEDRLVWGARRYKSFKLYNAIYGYYLDHKRRHELAILKEADAHRDANTASRGSQPGTSPIAFRIDDDDEDVDNVDPDYGPEFDLRGGLAPRPPARPRRFYTHGAPRSHPLLRSPPPRRSSLTSPRAFAESVLPTRSPTTSPRDVSATAVGPEAEDCLMMDEGQRPASGSSRLRRPDVSVHQALVAEHSDEVMEVPAVNRGASSSGQRPNLVKSPVPAHPPSAVVHAEPQPLQAAVSWATGKVADHASPASCFHAVAHGRVVAGHSSSPFDDKKVLERQRHRHTDGPKWRHRLHARAHSAMTGERDDPHLDMVRAHSLTLGLLCHQPACALAPLAAELATFPGYDSAPAARMPFVDDTGTPHIVVGPSTPRAVVEAPRSQHASGDRYHHQPPGRGWMSGRGADLRRMADIGASARELRDAVSRDRDVNPDSDQMGSASSPHIREPHGERIGRSPPRSPSATDSDEDDGEGDNPPRPLRQRPHSVHGYTHRQPTVETNIKGPDSTPYANEYVEWRRRFNMNPVYPNKCYLDARMLGAIDGADHLVLHEKPVEVCRRFRDSGACPKGGACKYAHADTSVPTKVKKDKTATSPCRLFRDLGKCRFGGACKYAHADTSVTTKVKKDKTATPPAPPQSAAPAVPRTPVDPTTTVATGKGKGKGKMVIDKAALAAAAKLNAKAKRRAKRAAAEQVALIPGAAASAGPLTRKHDIVCRHWMAGTCNRGDACAFAHAPTGTRSPAAHAAKGAGKATDEGKGTSAIVCHALSGLAVSRAGVRQMTIPDHKSSNSDDEMADRVLRLAPRREGGGRQRLPSMDHKSNSMTDQQSDIANGKMDRGASTPRFAAQANVEEATRPVVRPFRPSSGRSQHDELPHVAAAAVDAKALTKANVEVLELVTAHSVGAQAAADQPPLLTTQPAATKSAQTTPAPLRWSVGDPVQVLTDNQRDWMDGHVIAVFREDTQAEGHDIPAGTVKVQYKLGLKWIMPDGMTASLKRRAPLKDATAPTPVNVDATENTPLTAEQFHVLHAAKIAKITASEKLVAHMDEELCYLICTRATGMDEQVAYLFETRPTVKKQLAKDKRFLANLWPTGPSDVVYCLDAFSVLATREQIDVFIYIQAEIDKMIIDLKRHQGRNTHDHDWCINDQNKVNLYIHKGYDWYYLKELIVSLEATTAIVAETHVQMKRASQSREADNANSQQTVKDQGGTQHLLQQALARMSEVYVLLESQRAAR
jgi:hypothetical protein